MSTPIRQNRRSFMSVLTSLAGLTALHVTATEAAAQATAGAQTWDFRWIDDLKGKHRHVFDMADTDPASEPPPLRLPRNYLDGSATSTHRRFPRCRPSSASPAAPST